MNPRRRQMPLWLRDLATPRAVEYLLLVQEQSVSFMRLVGRGRLEEVFCTQACGAVPEAMHSFLMALPSHPLYYGQPFAVLLHHRRCYTYLHLLNSRSGEQLAQKARLLDQDDTHFHQEVRRVGNRRIFVGQGVDREYREGLLKTINAAGLPVISISSLGAQIARTAPLPVKPALYVFELMSGEHAYLVSDGRGQIGFGAIPVADERTDPRELGRCLLGPEVDLDVITYVTQDRPSRQKTQPHRLGALLRSAARRHGDRIPSGKKSMLLQRLVNVTKLLALILLSTAVLSGLLSVGLGRLMPPSDGPIAEYQRAYSRHLQLTAVVDSLTREIAQSRTGLPAHHVSAPWVSLFCRERLPRLYLNRLEVTFAETDAIRVQARGEADRESQIFRYLDMLRDGGHPFELHAMTPEVISVDSRPDTCLSFTLRLEGGNHGP